MTIWSGLLPFQVTLILDRLEHIFPLQQSTEALDDAVIVTADQRSNEFARATPGGGRAPSTWPSPRGASA